MRKLSRAVIIVALIGQFGCMSSAIKEAELPPLSPEAQARFADLSPEKAIANAEDQIKAAYVAEMDFYSPQYLKRAEEALRAAKKAAVSKKAEQGEVFVQVLALEAALKQAEITKSAVLRQMADVFELRAALDRVDAAHYKKRTYNKLMDRIQELVSHIEAERSDKFADKLPALVEDMTEFETNTIVHNALNVAALALEEAEDVDADDYAPKSFEKAELTYERAEQRIRANPHDAATVTRLGNNALVEAKHAFYVAKAVVALQEVKRDKMESIVLDEERRLGLIAEVLSISQIYDRSLQDQALTLSQAVSALLKSMKLQQSPELDGDAPISPDQIKGDVSDLPELVDEMAIEDPEPDFVDLSEELIEESTTQD